MFKAEFCRFIDLNPEPLTLNHTIQLCGA
jgi:hypothetical protein